MLGEEQQNLLLLIGGEGQLRPQLEELIRSKGLQDAVQLLGFVPEDQLAKYYQASDLVVMPTLQLEGFGLVTVEALGLRHTGDGDAGRRDSRSVEHG